jgi:hypothetical protein
VRQACHRVAEWAAWAAWITEPPATPATDRAGEGYRLSLNAGDAIAPCPFERGGPGCPDRQVSLTDPDARSMATSGKGPGVVRYNVQTAVAT